MSQRDAFVAVYGKHDTVEAAVREIVEKGLAMRYFNTVGGDCHTDEKVIGSCSASVPHAAGSDA